VEDEKNILIIQTDYTMEIGSHSETGKNGNNTKYPSRYINSSPL